MNQIRKRFYINRTTGLCLSAFTFLLMTTGCKKDFLNVDPQAQTPGQAFWKTQQDATEAVSAMYANLHEWNNIAFAPIAVESMPSDDAEKGSTPGDATFMNDYDNFAVSSTTSQIDGFWAGEYQTINFANQVIDNVDTMNTIDAALKGRYVAEAKFIRAYAYFRLNRAFGGVPLRLHLPAGTTEYNIPRNTTEEVYTAIEQDLTDAASVLPPSYGPADVGRITKGAALSLHAKVAMYQKKWQDVLDYTNQVMGLGYALFPNYEQMFRIANENCSESVFEIQCQYIPGNNDASNSQYSQVQGDRDVSPSVGWGFNVPTQDLSNAYETGDPRRNATILFAGETTPEGDVVPAPGIGSPSMYNQKSYVPFAIAAVNNQGADQNIRVIRYADVLLMNAEAANELGNSAQALSSLEMVRARARNMQGDAGVLPQITSTDQATLRSAIWHERRVELAMEYDRFFDLVRQGSAATVLASKGFKAGKNEVMPIPQNEIDLSAGVLTQNPGY